MNLVFECKVTKAPHQGGFLNIPKANVRHFPSSNSPKKVEAYLGSSDDPVKISWQGKHRRLRGLKKWFEAEGAKVGDTVSVEVIGRGEYRLTLVPGVPDEEDNESGPDVFKSKAAKWYLDFLERTSTSDWDGFNGFNGHDNDKDWTRYIENLLKSWGRNEDYQVITDFDSPVRIDVRWCKGKRDQVAIEHENVGDMRGRSLGDSSIGREVEKLLENTNAPLRVLITYFRDSSFSS